MFNLVIDAGHGKNTAGKRCLKKLDKNETREWVLNSRIADLVMKYLASYKNITILRTDDNTGKLDVSLSTRCKAANSFDADLFISIHHNAGANGGKSGGITLHSYKEHTWIKDLYNQLIAYTGLKGNRAEPIQLNSFYVVKHTKMPAVLIECGFMDSAVDVPIILSDAHARKTALAIVAFVVNYAKLLGGYVPNKPITVASELKDIHWLQNKLGVQLSDKFDKQTAEAVTKYYKNKGWETDNQPKYYAGPGTVNSLL